MGKIKGQTWVRQVFGGDRTKIECSHKNSHRFCTYEWLFAGLSIILSAILLFHQLFKLNVASQSFPGIEFDCLQSLEGGLAVK